MMTWALGSLTSLLPHVWSHWIYKHTWLDMDLVAHVLIYAEHNFFGIESHVCVCACVAVLFLVLF